MRRTTRVCLLALSLAAVGMALQADEPTVTNSVQQSAEALIVRASALSDSGQLEAALPLYIQAGQIDPEASMAFRGAGFVLLELDRPEEAIPYLEDALRIDSTAHRAWENLGLAKTRIYDRTLGEMRDLARKSTGGIVTENPILMRLEVLRAKYAERDWRAEGLDALREAVRLDPSEAMYWYNLGTALREYQPGPEATSALLKALELDPDYYPAMRNLALSLKHNGRYREARDMCMRMLEAYPDDSVAFTILADVAVADEDPKEAEQWFKKVLELEPNSIHAHINLAIIYKRRGDLDKAHEHTEKTIALDPEREQLIRSEIERNQ